MPFACESPPKRLLFLLLGTDLVFILLHFIYMETDWLSSPNFSIEEDRGYAEVFNYIKEFWIGLLFLYLAALRRNIFYFCWAIFFAYLALDDSFMIHEGLGAWIGSRLPFLPLFGLEAREVGEFCFLIALILVFLLVSGGAYFLHAGDIKKISRALYTLLGALIFFGVFMDLFHAGAESSPSHRLFCLAEEGGEMLVLSLFTWFVFYLPGDR